MLLVHSEKATVVREIRSALMAAAERAGDVDLALARAVTVHVLTGCHQYLYLDGHVLTLRWEEAVIDMYPDKVVLTEDGSYPE